MCESKIDATDRLRQEGRWEEASRFRDDQRRRLRAEGKPRCQAAELTWQRMIEEYPPPSPEEDALDWLAIAHFPPPNCPEPEPDQPRHEDIWYGYCCLLASRSYLDCDPPDLGHACGAMMRGWQFAASEPARAMQSLATIDPRHFLDVTERVFAATLGNWEAYEDDADNAASTAELRDCLDDLPALKQYCPSCPDL